jgi:uncharacterized protein YbbC (DUF1343 family)/CubicO group peptidase (beta-lactamase class C family)
MMLLTKRFYAEIRRIRRRASALRLLAGWQKSSFIHLVIAMALVSALLPPALHGQRKAANEQAAPLAQVAPESVGMASERLARIDEAVRASIERLETPGAVVLVCRRGRVVYRKAFGDRAVQPQREAMTVDTIFDLASLTKVVATTTAIMMLVERGKLSLADPVSLYIPEFAAGGKERVTIEQLMTHRAGLPPDNEISDYVGVSVKPLEEIYKLQPIYEPGTRFVYSDVGFIVAAEIVRRVSGKRIDEFARENIFAPLGMTNTAYLPMAREPWAVGRGPYEETPTSRDHSMANQSRASGNALSQSPAPILQRIAPTEMREGRWMRGEVHDPRSYEMGGVAGHAGLFSTADDLAIFCQMLLNKGEYNGVRLLAPYTIERMTSAQALPTSQMRGIGWDVNTSFSSNRGDLFPVGTFGHTGFTGTSLWLDPASQTFVILLTNRVHPNGKGDVTRLRSFVASIVAGAITAPPYGPVFDGLGAPVSVIEAPRAAVGRSIPPAGPLHPVLTGIDVLNRDGFKALEGRRVGLITNHTGRDREGRATIDRLAAAANCKLVALFSPEHGLRGTADAAVASLRDEKTGLPIYSLYDQETRRPTDAMLKDVDTLVFDIQDIGARFYTYTTTMLYAMEEAARRKLKFVVLDRPNPINGYDIEGPVADGDLLSFTAPFALPVRHGLTMGELALLFNGERKIGADLTVIKLEGWRRADYFDGTSLTWVNPSPNMRSLTEALLYPGIGLLETTNLSVGRGTDTPFELVGAPWIDPQALSDALNRAGLAGVRFVPVRFTPRASKFAGEACGGINIVITDRAAFRPLAVGVEIAYQINRLYSGAWKSDDYLRLLASRAALQALKAGKPAAEIAATWQAGLAQFARLRRKYLLY